MSITKRIQPLILPINDEDCLPYKIESTICINCTYEIGNILTK